MEVRSNLRSIAAVPYVSRYYFFNGKETVFGSYLLMGDELSDGTDGDRLLVSFSTVYTKFHLDRERRVLDLSYGIYC